MADGYWGKVLWVDLNKKESRVEELIPTWKNHYIGGEGFGVRLLFDSLPPGIDPLGPENLLMFTTGPLTGTRAPTAGRTAIVFKSPLTGTIGASNVGGFWAPAFKRCGFDMLVVSGKAEQPVYLWITDNNVEIRDAAAVWGKTLNESEEILRKEVENEKAVVAAIGPAGENLSLISAIMVDAHRAAGRGGPGAVMGSKNLKAVVCWGEKPVPVADSEALSEAARQARHELDAEDFVRDELKPFGTPSFTDSINALGILPTRNWQFNSFDAMEKIGHQAYHETLKVKPWPCWGCPIACGRHTVIQTGPFAGMAGGGPEYETIAAFGSKCGIDDLNMITAANHAANDLGLDIISTGQVIATAMEWMEKGVITKEQTGGVDLSFGNAQAMFDMVKAIAYRQGFGDLLANGSYRAAEMIGGDAMKYVMHVKKMEMAADGVYASKGEAISHMASERGACHLRPYASTIDAFGYVEPELGINTKASPTEDGNKAWFKPLKELSMSTNLLGVCLFASITLAVKPSTWARLLSAATGKPWTKEELLKVSERVINLERVYNAREGFDRKDDTLPERFQKEPGKDGIGEGQLVNAPYLLDQYYQMMGWDSIKGLPTPQKLKELDLEDLLPYV